MGNEFSKERHETGTYEWADINANCCLGCPHGCLYCYARFDALRYNRISSRDEWLIEKLNHKVLDKKWPKSNKVIMFPTAHDITPTNLELCLKVLRSMLVSGNKVLIVSKPHLSCVERMCTELKPWKEQILFRFTIGSFNTGVCLFWEPGAPSPAERYHALQYAYEQGYQTSVSMEPILEGCHEALVTFNMVKNYVTDTIWIGKMNKMRSRVDMTNPNNEFMVKDLEERQCDEEILRLVERLKDEPKVRWKDSIKKVIAAHSDEEGI